MEERKRPYLGKCVIPDAGAYVVLFSLNEKDKGIIVSSEIENNPDLQVGIIGDFDEERFEYMDSEDQVRLFND